MVSIKEFIQQQVLIPRLQQNGVLAVHDPDRRYRELCLELASEEVRVVDASESSIESREAALKALLELGQTSADLKGLLVYVPAEVPLDDDHKMRDPFALYRECGSKFPDGDSDEYINLCIKAKPDFRTEIRRVFKENPDPSFAVIDAIGGGSGWPNLQALLGVESAQDILFALLVPSPSQQEDLKSQDAWVSEAKELIDAALGLKLTTREKTLSSISDQLWRFLLFSEFVFDLPEKLPEALVNVQCAQEEAKPLVEYLCERLRSDIRAQVIYIERAESVEQELNLPQHCKDITSFGERDTFPFEERRFLKQAVSCLEDGDVDAVRDILKRHQYSVWMGKGESQVQWELLRVALELTETCDDRERELPNHSRSLESLMDFYAGSLWEADRLHREFEQAVCDYIEVPAVLKDVVALARSQYRRLADKVQDLFIRNFIKSGWPPIGQLANKDVFNHFVSPKLQDSGYRIALFLVDALRFELGVVLGNQLIEDGQVEIKTAFAQLPSITSVGMASLLPGAEKSLALERSDSGKVVPVLDGVPVENVSKRMDVLRQLYGQRFEEMTLNNFINKKRRVQSFVELLVLRSTHIDAQFEKAHDTALALTLDTLKKIRVAVNRLKKMGFHEVVIATDHGFVLNVHSQAGDVASKPQGDWVNIHERCLLGQGTADASNFIVNADEAGIHGDFSQLAGPKALVPYRDGLSYFHGGVSLQELILPVITLRMVEEEPDSDLLEIKVNLTYKDGTKRITTLMPVIDVALEVLGLFGKDEDLEILLEAHDPKGNVVGEARAGGPVNPATGTMVLRYGERFRVTLKMDEEFEGKFKIIALNPINLTSYGELELKTDYVR
jgi:hypothetical protein